MFVLRHYSIGPPLVERPSVSIIVLQSTLTSPLYHNDDVWQLSFTGGSEKGIVGKCEKTLKKQPSSPELAHEKQRIRQTLRFGSVFLTCRPSKFYRQSNNPLISVIILVSGTGGRCSTEVIHCEERKVRAPSDTMTDNIRRPITRSGKVQQKRYRRSITGGLAPSALGR